MLWVALSVRKAIYAMSERWDKFLLLLDKNASALGSFSAAQERQARATEEATEEARDARRDRPRTDPQIDYTPVRDKRPKSTHPR